jgi:amino acid transporter
MIDDPPQKRARSFLRISRNPARAKPSLPRYESGEEPVAPAKKHRARPNGDREAHTRIVIPRQQRGDPSGVGVELREVRLGASGTPYLRVVPRSRRLKSVSADYIEATPEGSRPRGRIERAFASVRRVILGSPYSTSQIIHERLSKFMALPIFASDALSSSAYATEEILLVLVLAGTGAFTYSLPIAGAIAVLLVLVAVSYRQTINAYPNGGGAYIVARENLGTNVGLVAAGALLVDYVLTVSVSVAAGVAAVTSAAPDLQDFRVIIGVAVVALITLGNLRGVRESGAIFAAPTYFFILAMTSLIVIGLAKVIIGDAPGSFLHAAPPETSEEATKTLGLFLILKAFSSGCAALTGIEAISNGVPAFKSPEPQNARTTLAWMAGILLFLFIGITFLASRFGLVANEHETIISQLAKEVLGKNFGYYGVQVATALVLFLAANTSYADFPRLSAILARDGFMPRQFTFRGDRLAFSNGILALAVASSALLVIYGGRVSNLIPLYAVGVFVSFTLSQSGMVRHWLRFREPGWRTSLAVNAVGAAGTGVVAVIIGGTKFVDGAWLSLLMMALLVVGFSLIHRHYQWFERQIHVGDATLAASIPRAFPLDQAASKTHVIVPVDGINKISLGAVAMAREIGGKVTAIHLTDDRAAAEAFRETWKTTVPDVSLLVIESPYRSFVAPMIAYLQSVLSSEDARVIVILPAFLAHRPWQKFLHNRDVQRLRPHIRDLGVQVVDYKYDLEGPASDPQN